MVDTQHAQCKRDNVISVGVHIGECYHTLRCRIEGYSSEPNTKVYGDSHDPFKHFPP